MNRLLFVLALILLSSSAHAEKGQGGSEHGIKVVVKYADADGDGNITYKEFMQAKWKYFDFKFNQLDANGDGMVSHREYMEFHREKGDEMFSKLDANGDGVVTAEERESGSKMGHGDKQMYHDSEFCKKKHGADS